MLNGESISAFNNVTLAPLSIDAVVKKIDQLVNERATRLHHYSGTREITYLELARELAVELGVSFDLVREVSLEPEDRIRYTSLR